MKDGVLVAFRTSRGARVGLGHLRRCLALAGALRGMGAESVFLLDGDVAVAGDEVAAAGFEAARVRPEHDLTDTRQECRARRAAAVVVDSYGVGRLGERYLRGLAEGRGVVAIDDLADRELTVDLVVNGSAGAERLVYRGAPQTRYLLGPRYIPLRPEFAEPPARVFPDGVRRVLITLGGGDEYGLTARLVRWTAKTLGAVGQDVVVGPYFEGTEAVREEARVGAGSVVLHESPQEMRRLMLGADLAICGGGQTTYELAATGTPAIAVRLADNQTINLKGLSEAGTLVWAGDAGDADLESALADALTTLASDRARRAEMSRRGRELVDGQGAERVARAILDVAEERVA